MSVVHFTGHQFRYPDCSRFQRADEDSDSSDSEEMFYDATSEKPDLIGVGPRCRARFDFDGEGPEDLVFEDGDVIKLLERVGPEWRKGELNGKVGLFPLSFVEIIEDLPADEAPDETSLVVNAMFDYEGQDDELSFQVRVLYSSCIDHTNVDDCQSLQSVHVLKYCSCCSAASGNYTQTCLLYQDLDTVQFKDISKNIFLSLSLIEERQLSVTSERIGTKSWLAA